MARALLLGLALVVAAAGLARVAREDAAGVAGEATLDVAAGVRGAAASVRSERAGMPATAATAPHATAVPAAHGPPARPGPAHPAHAAARCDGAPERCDGADNDCDGAIDEPGAMGCSAAYRDEDADGFGALADGCFCARPPAHVSNALDCDDARADVHPGSAEVCDGQVDNDCDGYTDLCGARPHQTLVPGDLAILAVQEQSAGLDDPLSERFEIENRTSHRLELMGLEVGDDGVDGFRIRRSLVLEAGERKILGRNGDLASNGGTPVDYVYSDFILSNPGDAIELRSGPVVIARFDYAAPAESP